MNKPIILTPSDEFGGDKKRLIQFYKRFGFVENKEEIKGHFKDYYNRIQHIDEFGYSSALKKLLMNIIQQRIIFYLEKILN
ncbi:MAG: hypothetical protein PHF21_04935 [Bacilli bacterium]|nr:hypothetical protein [Bacilli bacterium]